METPSDNPTRTVLVTGASGFIGAHLCRRLRKLGHRVAGVSRRHPENLPDGVEPCRADLASPGETAALLARIQPEWIFHLAGCVTGGRGMELVRPTFEANLASTVNLMEAAARQGGCRRFVLAGSLEEPDAVQSPPSSPYAASKAAATAYARLFHSLYDFPAVIARIFMVYGPDQKDARKLVPYVIDSLLRGEAPRLSSGTREVDWIYVDDVVDGLIRLAAAPDLEGRTLDLGSGERVSVRDVVERIARLTGAAVPLHFDPAADRPMEQIRTADAARTESLAGWRPRVTLDEGLLATIAWHRRRMAPEP
ncbi:MAG TPA: SDR family NAD(P)-dependent oxidoreductase [Kiritimatiellia bacterium]|nr:SDR family NAD(P)-dependent oxidoreductase [Kiritimatiellia bacterium]